MLGILDNTMMNNSSLSIKDSGGELQSANYNIVSNQGPLSSVPREE